VPVSFRSFMFNLCCPPTAKSHRQLIDVEPYFPDGPRRSNIPGSLLTETSDAKFEAGSLASDPEDDFRRRCRLALRSRRVVLPACRSARRRI
jgi:hypothetical protein